MKKIQVYDPAMCCSTGVCGPSVDPELVRISRDLDALKRSGVEVVRYNLGQEPQAFVENAAIGKLLEAEGPDVLPVTVVDGNVAKSKSYPTKAELESWLGKPIDLQASNQLLSDQIKELIAIGAAVAANCEPCFKYHYDRARKLGVTKDEMIEAVEVGDAVKNAATQNILTLAERYLVGKSTRLETVGGGCCGSDDESCC